MLEKQICLAVGKRVAGLLKQKNFEVLLTRSDDSTILLDQRTTYANINGADLFVSIHANYASNAQAHGIETFCFDNGLLTLKSSTLPNQDVQNVHVSASMKSKQSKKLADTVHQALLSKLQKKYLIRDRKVKYAASQVLMGTQMPAILIELGFISNPQEAVRLQKVTYQKEMAQAICDGVCKFIKG